MGKLIPEQKRQLSELIKEYGLDPYADKIIDMARNSLLMRVTDPHDETSIGTTRLGGLPDLPQPDDWPKNGEQSMRFLGQINLLELPNFPGNPLPENGTLLFFLGDDSNSRNIKNRVLYFPPSEMQNCTGATPCPLDIKKEDIFAPFNVTFEHALSLPSDASILFENLQLKNGEIDRYYDLKEDLNCQPAHPELSRLLGYPDSLSSDPSADAFFFMSGHHNPLHETTEMMEEYLNEATSENNLSLIEYYKKLKSDILWYQNNKNFADKEILSWILLLEIDSHSEPGMTWGDSGKIHFMIEEDSIQKKNFSSTYAGLLSS